MIEPGKIQEVINKIVANYNPDKVILFGSYASGEPSENSDVDLLIVKDTPLPRHRRGREVRRFLYGSMVPLDILVYTNKEIDESKDVRFSFVHTVMNTGKVIYARQS